MSASRVIDRGADQRFGKGIRAVTLDKVPEERERGMEGGMSELISYSNISSVHDQCRANREK